MFERQLAKISRRLGQTRGLRKIPRALRAFYTPFYVGRGDRWTTIDDYDGSIRMTVDRGSYLGSAIYWQGTQHPREMGFLKRYLERDMVFADIGANQGEFTLLAAKHVPEGQVFAFEPEARMNALLRNNVDMNAFSNVKVLECALGATDGEVDLYAATSDKANVWNEGLFTSHPSDESMTFVQRAKVRRLDDVAEGEGLRRLDVIKLDAEGAELYILQGALQTLERFRPVLIVEINALSFQAAGYQPSAVYDLLTTLGYTSYTLTREGRLKRIDAAAPGAEFFNALFIPLVQRESLRLMLP